MAWSPGTPSWVRAALNRKPQTLPIVRLGVRAPPHGSHAEDDGDGEYFQEQQDGGSRGVKFIMNEGGDDILPFPTISG